MQPVTASLSVRSGHAEADLLALKSLLPFLGPKRAQRIHRRVLRLLNDRGNVQAVYSNELVPTSSALELLAQIRIHGLDELIVAALRAANFNRRVHGQPLSDGCCGDSILRESRLATNLQEPANA